MSAVISFLQDLQNNDAIMAILGNPTSQINSYITYIQDLENQVNTLSSLSSRSYVKVTPQDGDYGSFIIQNGKFKWKYQYKFTAFNKYGDFIAGPIYALNVDDEIWIGSYTTAVARFDNNFSFLGYFGRYGYPTNTGYYMNMYGMAYDPNTEYVYIACYTYHVVKIFDKSGTEIGTIGTPGVLSYDPNTGNLSYPYDVNILPNGNVLVTCYYGNPPGSNGNFGYIAEFTPSGTFVKIHLMSTSTGTPWVNEIRYPGVTKLIQNPNTNIYELWVIDHSVDTIAVFEYDDTNNVFNFKHSFNKPTTISWGTGYYFTTFDISSDYKYLYTSVGSNDILISYDIQTHDVINIKGYNSSENWPYGPETLFANAEIRAILEYGNELIIGDYINNRIYVIPRDVMVGDVVNIPINETLPNFSYIEHISDNRFDPNTLTIKFDPKNDFSIPDQIYVCGVNC